MLSVFSNKRVSDKIQALNKCAGNVFDRTLLAGPESESLYILKPQAIGVLVWINKKILFELPKIKTAKDVQWIGVRIRIATNMLNKLESKHIIPKDVCIEYHRRLTTNVRKIVGEIYTEDLPF